MGAQSVAEVSGKFYVLGLVGDSSGQRILAAAVGADCALDAVLTTRIGSNPYNLAQTVTPTGDGNLLIRGGTQQFIPPPWQYFKMFVDPGLNPVRTEIDDRGDFFVSGQAPYPDGTVVLVGSTGAGLTRFALKQENPDGTPILAFGGRGDGTITIGFGPNTHNFALAGTLQSDGTMLFAVGEMLSLSGGGVRNAVASLTPDGTVIGTNTFSAVEGNQEMSVAAAPRTGAGFVGATVSMVPGGGSRSFLYCASDDLTVDTACGTDGWTEIATLPDSSHYLRGLAQRDGGYVGLVNSCPFGGRCQTFAFCVDENIALDGSCAGSGVRMIDVGPGENSARALAARTNGTYVAVIDNCTSSSECRPAIACFDSDLTSTPCQ